MTDILRKHPIRAVLFDFDGTLTLAGALDFAAIRRTIGCPSDQLILEYIHAVSDPTRRRKAAATLQEAELDAAARSAPMPGAEDTVLALIADGIPVGILTRNSRSSVDRSLLNFRHLTGNHFDPIITRESSVAVKPAPDGILHAASHWRVSPEAVMMVGDFRLDVEAGHAAGAVTVLLAPEPPDATMDPPPDHMVTNLTAILPMIGIDTG